MTLVAAAVQAVLLLMWAASAIFCILSAYTLAAFYRRARREKPSYGGHTPPLTVMKPIKGADPDTYENLASFVHQDYPAYQIIFGIADPADPARGIAERLVMENPDIDMSVVTTGEPVGPNYKVSNLHYMLPEAKYDILVIADGDMRVGPGYLAAVGSGFADPGVGVVTCPYRGAYPEDAGSALEALSINSDFFPSVTLAERLEGMSFALGATMAVRREALEKIGGFRVLSCFLADDYQLGYLVKKAGYGIVLSGYVVDAVGRHEDIAGYFSHQLRWGRTYRVSRPGGWFMSVVTRGTGLSVLFLLATGFSTAGWAVFTANLAVRYLQFLVTEAGYVRGPGVAGYFWLLPVRDLIGFVVWAMSFTGDTVSWKDASFRIERDGRMTRLDA